VETYLVAVSPTTRVIARLRGRRIEMSKVVVFGAMMLLAVSAHAQGKPRKADASLIANLNALENGINKVMETEGSRINFSRWDASIALIDASKAEYETQRGNVDLIRTGISKIKQSGMASSVQLFLIYSSFRNVLGILGDLEKHADQSQKDVALATDLTNMHVGLAGEEIKLDESLLKFLVQDSNDLGKCDGKSY